MTTYNFCIRGSFLLQVLLDVDWNDSDIDFYGDSNLAERATTKDMLKSVFLGNISYINRIPPTKNDGRTLGPTTCDSMLIGSRIDITWNSHLQNLTNYEFLQNSWSPQNEIVAQFPMNIILRFGTCDVYSELLTRVKIGQSVIHALERIFCRICKYSHRGFTILF